MRDLNYFPLDVESNIYGMTTLEFDDKTTKVLVATSDCQIYCINYSNFKPKTREVEFTYIPNGAKIISIGSLKRGRDDFVIGITHSLAPNLQKSSAPAVGDYNRLTTYYLNIYASGTVSPNFDLDYVAQGCQTLRLRYVPYHLYSTELILYQQQQQQCDNLNTARAIRRKPIWLLSGGDKCIHVFSEDSQYRSFNEIITDEYFPELNNLPGIALWIDVLNLEKEDSRYERVIALGFEEGTVKLYHSILSIQTNRYELVAESTFDEYTTIVPNVRLFSVKSTNSSRLRRHMISNNLIESDRDSDARITSVNLLAISSTNPSIVFENVLEYGLDRKLELPESQRMDCVIATAIGDSNVDGLNEIVVGTYGQELLTYQYDLQSGRYKLENVSMLNYPIFSLEILDLTGDALKDVVILLTNGVLVMQGDVEDVLKVLKSRLETIIPRLK